MCIFCLKSLTLAVDDIYKNVNDNDGARPADACTAGTKCCNINDLI